MAGFDLGRVLRQKLGGGQAIPEAALGGLLARLDKNRDGALSFEEFEGFLRQKGVGRAWLSRPIAAQLWSETQGSRAVMEPRPIPVLAASLARLMRQRPRAESSYLITPRAARGEVKRRYLGAEGKVQPKAGRAAHPAAGPAPERPKLKRERPGAKSPSGASRRV